MKFFFGEYKKRQEIVKKIQKELEIELGDIPTIKQTHKRVWEIYPNFKKEIK